MHNFYKIPSINCILITGTYRHHLSPDATYTEEAGCARSMQQMPERVKEEER